MDLTTIFVLAFGLITTLMIFGMIIYGVKNQEKMSNLQKNLDTSAANLEGSAQEMLLALRESKEQQQGILNRLQNLEAIVASEAWDAIQAGEDEKKIDLLLEDKEENEPTPEEKAKIIAKRVR